MGYSEESFAYLPIEQKVEYFLELSEYFAPGKVADFIRRNYKLSNRICIRETQNGDIHGFSKFGGLPLAPEGFEFPKDEDGQSALFLGQIHIRDFNRWHTRDLSGDGIIYIFGTVVEEYGSYHLKDILMRYSNQTQGLRAIDLPEDSAEFGIFPERDMMIYEEINIPDSDSVINDLAEMGFDENGIYSELKELISTYEERKSFKFLGYPGSVQHCALFEAEMKQQKLLFYGNTEYTDESFMQTYLELRERSLNWRLFLELDMMLFPGLERYEGNFNAGMDGVFFVMLSKEDLDELRLEKAVTIYQAT